MQVYTSCGVNGPSLSSPVPAYISIPTLKERGFNHAPIVASRDNSRTAALHKRMFQKEGYRFHDELYAIR